ncbi:MAG: hypothetical protein M1484_00090 [Patescibacteria group bacterium]|nr:hypothetical protein [Patescibacteria group bacterium]
MRKAEEIRNDFPGANGFKLFFGLMAITLAAPVLWGRPEVSAALGTVAIAEGLLAAAYCALTPRMGRVYK